MRKLSTLLLALVLALSIAMPALAVDVQVPLTEEPVTFRIMVTCPRTPGLKRNAFSTPRSRPASTSSGSRCRRPAGRRRST